MAELAPTLAPTEMPDAEMHRQKSEADIAAQIGRISRKLSERSLNTGVTLNDLGNENSLHNFDINGQSTAVMEHPTPGSQLTSNIHLEEGGDSVMVSKTHQVFAGEKPLDDGSKKKELKITANPSEGTVNGTFSSYGVDERGKFVSRSEDKLTNKQVVSASAQVLGKIRNEIAKQEKKEAGQSRIDDFIKK